MKNLILMLFIQIVFSGCDKLLGFYFGYPAASPTFTLPKREEDNTVIDSSTVQLLLLNESDTYFFKGNQILDGRFIKLSNLTFELKKQLKKSTDRDFSILLKPSMGASYKSIIELLDIMATLQIKNYKMIELSTTDKEFINNLK